MPADKQIGSKKNIVILICLLVFSLMVTWQTLRRALFRVASDFYHPYLDIPVQTEKYLADKSLLIQSKNTLVATIVRLRNENRRLKAENELSRNLRDENIGLRRLMRLSTAVRGEIIFADIVVRDPLSWNERFTVDKGSENGVVPGTLVLTADRKNGKVAVVGRVVEVSKHSAAIVTIICPRNSLSRLSVKLPESGVTGIIEGAIRKMGKTYARLIWLPKNHSYRIGEEVVSYGAGGFSIPSIHIGQLADFDGTGKAAMLKNRLYKEAYIKPSADIESLKTVMLVVGKKR